jgi:hypothetical protein
VGDIVNGPDGPRDPDDVEVAGERDAIDELDVEILDRISGLHGRLDGPPDDFDEEMVFAIAAAELGAELARLVEQELVAARGSDERIRAMSFVASSLTILLTLTKIAGDRVRIDGWLAPGARHDVQLRSRREGATDRRTAADDAGRFVIDRVRRGLTQVVVRLGDGRLIVTPTFEL